MKCCVATNPLKLLSIFYIFSYILVISNIFSVSDMVDLIRNSEIKYEKNWENISPLAKDFVKRLLNRKVS